MEMTEPQAFYEEISLTL